MGQANVQAGVGGGLGTARGNHPTSGPPGGSHVIGVLSWQEVDCLDLSGLHLADVVALLTKDL
jgi:hypothetical protein